MASDTFSGTTSSLDKKLSLTALLNIFFFFTFLLVSAIIFQAHEHTSLILLVKNILYL